MNENVVFFEFYKLFTFFITINYKQFDRFVLNLSTRFNNIFFFRLIFELICLIVNTQ